MRDLIEEHPLAPPPHPELVAAVTDHVPVNGHGTNGHANGHANGHGPATL